MEKCTTCGTVDRSGYINGMCTDCFDLYLDIGKPDTGEKMLKKKSLEKGRISSGYFSK